MPAVEEPVGLAVAGPDVRDEAGVARPVEPVQLYPLKRHGHAAGSDRPGTSDGRADDICPLVASPNVSCAVPCPQERSGGSFCPADAPATTAPGPWGGWAPASRPGAGAVPPARPGPPPGWPRLPGKPPRPP